MEKYLEVDAFHGTLKVAKLSSLVGLLPTAPTYRRIAIFRSVVVSLSVCFVVCVWGDEKWFAKTFLSTKPVLCAAPIFNAKVAYGNQQFLMSRSRTY
jgi:hypothetical protein